VFVRARVFACSVFFSPYTFFNFYTSLIVFVPKCFQFFFAQLLLQVINKLSKPSRIV